MSWRGHHGGSPRTPERGGQSPSTPVVLLPSESYSIAVREGSMSASAVSGLAALSGPSSGLSSDPCSPIPPGPVTGLRRWLDHSKHCLSVETEAESGQTGQCEVSRESHRRRTLGKSAGWGHQPSGNPSTSVTRSLSALDLSLSRTGCWSQL